MRHIILISAIIFLCSATLHPQNKYFPLKGKVLSSDSLSPIPDVHILSEKSYYGATSDYDGKFSMLIRKNDSLRISSVGFVTQHLPINHDSINADNYLIIMQRDTIMLQEIDVFPYLDNHRVEEIISKIPTSIPKYVLTQHDININIENYYYNKTKDLPRIRGWHFIFYNPFKKVYDRYNKKERLKRKLEKNRKRLGIEN